VTQHSITALTGGVLVPPQRRFGIARIATMLKPWLTQPKIFGALSAHTYIRA